MTPESREKVNARARRYHAERKHDPEYRARRREWSRINKRKLRRANNAAVAQIKEAGVCADCGGKFPAVAMDFDHVRGEKVACVGTLVAQARPIARIEAEIAKCDLVCSNCHRVRTATTPSWQRTA